MSTETLTIESCCAPPAPCLTADPDLQGLLDDLSAVETQQEYDDILDQLTAEVQTEEGATFVVVQIAYYLAHVVENPGALLVYQALSDLDLTGGGDRLCPTAVRIQL